MANEHVLQSLAIYVAANTLTLETGSASHLLATSEGEGGVNVADTDVYWTGQDMVDSKGQLVKRDVTITLGEVTVMAASLTTLLGISSSATASLHNAAGNTATAYRILSTTTKIYFRVGLQMTNTDTGFTEEWYAPRCQIMGDIPYAINKEVFNVQELTFKAFKPASGAGTIIEHLAAAQ